MHLHRAHIATPRRRGPTDTGSRARDTITMHNPHVGGITSRVSARSTIAGTRNDGIVLLPAMAIGGSHVLHRVRFRDASQA